MLFIILTFFAAFLIEGLGTAVSVIGLSTLFGANPIIIALAIALDLGKLVVVSLLYTYWGRLGKIMRGYAFIAAAVTMTITSAGAAGYLSGEFQKAILGTQEIALKVDVLKKQSAKYEERKKQIDEQISKLPEKTTVNQRLRLMNGFKAEQKDLQDKIAGIDKDLPAMQVVQIGTEAKAGPILYIAKAFNISVEAAVKYVILMIIFVFDPLAVFLIIAGNFLLEQRRKILPRDHVEVEPDTQPDAPIHTVPPPQVMTETRARVEELLPAITAAPASWVITERWEPQSSNPSPPENNTVLSEITPEPAAAEHIIEDILVQPAPPEREQITLDQLRLTPRSSLSDVEPDHTVTFETNPPVSTASVAYSNLK